MPYLNSSSADRKPHTTANNRWYFNGEGAPEKSAVNTGRKRGLLLALTPHQAGREDAEKVAKSPVSEKSGSRTVTFQQL